MTLPDGPVIVASSLVGSWCVYGYVAGTVALSRQLRRRRVKYRNRIHPPEAVTPAIVLEDQHDLGSWIVRERDLDGTVDLGDGIDVEADLDWWEEVRRDNASQDRVEERPVVVLAGLGVGRP